ncbi:MAG: dTDP-4-dehydrorhamnose reductase [Chloroflexota bacterium]|nr:dTDP-4-dehydrorhamnose reductase [Chloroflexota bacterium]
MRIAITGYTGQLGSSLHRLLADEELFLIGRPEHDFTDPAIIQALVDFKPKVVIHAGAYTDVEGCAREPDLAYLTNGVGSQHIGLACQQTEAVMVYISTNEVFDGQRGEPYLEWDQPHPINPYGASKLAGEFFTRSLVARHYIVRTSWLYAPGGDNFPTKIIRAADKHGHLSVVVDEISSPTYAPDLAQAILQLIETGFYGTYHFTNEGACSRYQFALKVLELSGRGDIPVEPITSDQYPRLSTPPLNCVLRNFCGACHGITLRHWQEALEEFFSG